MTNSKNSTLSLFVYGGNGGSGGLVSYCKGLLGSRSVPLDIDVCFICSPEFYNELGSIDSSLQVVIHPWISSRFLIKRLIWNLWLYPWMLLKKRPNIEFYPSGILPLFRRFFLRGSVHIATPCHNLLPFDSQELWKKSFCPEYKDLLMVRKRLVRSLERASCIIFTSEYSKDIVLGYLATNPKYTVIPNGLEVDFLLEMPRSYEIGSSVTLLYISPVFSYKHHDSVVRSVKYVRDITGRDVCLRLVGGGGASAVQKLEKLIKSEQAECYVTLVGKLGREELRSELTNADIFVFASSCEAFGITLLEGMGFRLPIACSKCSGLDAILRDAGLYFNPENHLSIADAIINLLSSKEIRKDFGEKAYEYAQQYTWRKCANETFCFLSTTYREKVALGAK